MLFLLLSLGLSSPIFYHCIGGSYRFVEYIVQVIYALFIRFCWSFSQLSSFYFLFALFFLLRMLFSFLCVDCVLDHMRVSRKEFFDMLAQRSRIAREQGLCNLRIFHMIFAYFLSAFLRCFSLINIFV